MISTVTFDQTKAKKFYKCDELDKICELLNKCTKSLYIHRLESCHTTKKFLFMNFKSKFYTIKIYDSYFNFVGYATTDYIHKIKKDYIFKITGFEIPYV